MIQNKYHYISYKIYFYNINLFRDINANIIQGQLSSGHRKWRSLAGGHPKLSHLLEDTLVTDNYAAGHRAPYFIHFHWLRRESSCEMTFLPLPLSSSSLPFSFSTDKTNETRNDDTRARHGSQAKQCRLICVHA